MSHVKYLRRVLMNLMTPRREEYQRLLVLLNYHLRDFEEEEARFLLGKLRRLLREELEGRLNSDVILDKLK